MTIHILPTTSAMAASVENSFTRSVTVGSGPGSTKQDGRGRKLYRHLVEGAVDGDNLVHPDSPQNATPRKRKKSRKGIDKKFNCQAENCGKSYSRAEHLYRHQLNRKCDCNTSPDS